MIRRLVVSRPAESDLDEESEYLGVDDPALAERFLAAADATFADLAATPGLGRVREFHANAAARASVVANARV